MSAIVPDPAIWEQRGKSGYWYSGHGAGTQARRIGQCGWCGMEYFGGVRQRFCSSECAHDHQKGSVRPQLHAFWPRLIMHLAEYRAGHGHAAVLYKYVAADGYGLWNGLRNARLYLTGRHPTLSAPTGAQLRELYSLGFSDQPAARQCATCGQALRAPQQRYCGEDCRDGPRRRELAAERAERAERRARERCDDGGGRLVSLTEAGAMLGVSRERARQFTADGRLTTVRRTGHERLVREAEVMALAARRAGS